ncbi:MAG: ankyrin repeat domain-containing protein [Gammaproteobacteria bacterium]
MENIVRGIFVSVLFAAAFLPFAANAQEARPCELCVAAATHNRDEVLRLLSAGEDPNKRTHYDATALHYAARANATGIIRDLLDAGADLEAEDNRGLTPFFVSVLARHPSVVELLAARGADINVQADNDWTPLTFAARYGLTGVLNLMLNSPSLNADRRGPFAATVLDMAAIRGDPEIMRMILQRYNRVFLTNNFGTTPLMFAAYYGRVDVAEVLIEETGGPLNQRDINGRTALMIAVSAGHPEIVEVLLKAGASLLIKDNAGNDFAAYQTPEFAPNVIQPVLSPELQPVHFCLGDYKQLPGEHACL